MNNYRPWPPKYRSSAARDNLLVSFVYFLVAVACLPVIGTIAAVAIVIAVACVLLCAFVGALAVIAAICSAAASAMRRVMGSRRGR